MLLHALALGLGQIILFYQVRSDLMTEPVNMGTWCGGQAAPWHACTPYWSTWVLVTPTLLTPASRQCTSWEATGDAFSHSVPASYVEYPDGALGSWLWLVQPQLVQINGERIIK